MNNFTFGFDGPRGLGYYETIAGGSGAGPTWNGTSGAHTHMTNTRITDPESLERRYPVVLRRFCLREGSGGRGTYKDGEGVIRDVECRLPMAVSILSERRSSAPYGMEGGEEGGRGHNTWVSESGRQISIGGKNIVPVQIGDRVVIETPGGGGYGAPERLNGVTGNRTRKTSTCVPVAGGSIQEVKGLGEQVSLGRAAIAAQ